MVSLACIFDAHEVCGLDGCGCKCHKGETSMSLPEDVEEELGGCDNVNARANKQIRKKVVR